VMINDPSKLRQLTTHNKIYVMILFMEGEMTLVADMMTHKFESIKKV